MPPRKRRSRDREKTRAAIIDTAGEIFLEKGLVALTNRAIAKKVGVNASLIYHYFPNQDALVVEMLEAFWAPSVLQFAQIFKDGLAQGNFTEYVVRAYADFLFERPDAVRCMAHWLTSRNELAPKLPWSAEIRAAYDECLDIIAQAQKNGLLRADVDPLAVGFMTVGTLEYWFLSEREWLEAEPESLARSEREVMIEALVKMITQALKP